MTTWYITRDEEGHAYDQTRRQGIQGFMVAELLPDLAQAGEVPFDELCEVLLRKAKEADAFVTPKIGNMSYEGGKVAELGDGQLTLTMDYGQHPITAIESLQVTL